MQIIDFLLKWADLISAVFAKYLFAAALLTLLAVIAFFGLRAQWKVDSTPKLIGLIAGLLLAWAICVPILGWMFNVFAVAGDFSVFLYKRYDQQPIFFLITTGIVAVATFVWCLFRKGPNRFWKIACSLPLWFAVILIGVPLANHFSPSKKSAPETNQVSSAKP